MRIVFGPLAIAHVFVQAFTTVPVRIDQLPACGRADSLGRKLRRTAVRLYGLAGRIGDRSPLSGKNRSSNVLRIMRANGRRWPSTAR